MDGKIAIEKMATEDFTELGKLVVEIVNEMDGIDDYNERFLQISSSYGDLSFAVIDENGDYDIDATRDWKGLLADLKKIVAKKKLEELLDGIDLDDLTDKQINKMLEALKEAA